MKAEGQAIAERFKSELGMEYLDRLPLVIPSDKVMVHNSFSLPPRRLGRRGFRAWLVAVDDDRWTPRREVCDCGFAPELGTHYRLA